MKSVNYFFYILDIVSCAFKSEEGLEVLLHKKIILNCIIVNVTTVPIERSAEARVSSRDIFISLAEETTDRLVGWDSFYLK